MQKSNRLNIVLLLACVGAFDLKLAYKDDDKMK